jgi:tetratricopeptide (TPR) repeat protein
MGAMEISPSDPGVLNELGVIYLKLDKLDLAISNFEEAISILRNENSSSFNNEKSKTSSFKRSCSLELFNNYATSLRKARRYDEALLWFNKCLSTNPKDASIFASKGHFIFYFLILSLNSKLYFKGLLYI